MTTTNSKKSLRAIDRSSLALVGGGWCWSGWSGCSTFDRNTQEESNKFLGSDPSWGGSGRSDGASSGTSAGNAGSLGRNSR